MKGSREVIVSDALPTPDPHGALQPPNRLPPTAVGTAMLPPEEPARARSREQSGLTSAIRRMLERVFDASDEWAERIRRRLLRR